MLIAVYFVIPLKITMVLPYNLISYYSSYSHGKNVSDEEIGGKIVKYFKLKQIKLWIEIITFLSH